MYKKGITKEKFASKMRYFWTIYWKYGTIDVWVDTTKAKIDIDNEDHTLWRNSGFTKEIYNDWELLQQAIDKLVLEKLLKKDEAKRIRELLKSPDSENHYIAISIMASRKPKKFKDGQKTSE